MTLNKKRPFSTNIFWVIMASLLVLGCAVQQRPQGGPRDTNPPKLLLSTPPKLTHNFNAKEIRMDFDEYIKLVNQFQEFTVFPAPDKKAPDYKIRGKSLIIEFQDTLLKNTTYVINFGKGIQDVNESNILKNFTYVFSTGNHIDSLSISGNVTNNQTQQNELNATVMLFTLNQDSLLFGKKKPSLYTTTDSAGNFTLGNLKEGVYKLYALKEIQGGDKIYNNDNELIAFSTKPINLTHDTANVKLKLFKQAPTKTRFVDRKFMSDGSMLFSLNKPLAKPSVKILYPPGLDEQKIVDFSKTGDTAMVYSKNMDFDSIRVAFFDNNKPVDTTSLRKGRKESFTRNVTFRYGVDINSELRPGADLKIYTSLPIQAFEQQLITLREDSNQVSYTIARDTGSTKRFILKYRFKPKSAYALTMEEGAFTSIFGDKNKKLTKKFTINKPENFSNLTLKVNVPDSTKMYVVELLDDSKNVLRTDVITKKTTLLYRNYYVGKFTVRVVYDGNRNGKWDSGSVKEARQPENIWVYEKQFTLRPNWEQEEIVEIPKEVITP
jgi:hypothetical protein